MVKETIVNDVMRITYLDEQVIALTINNTILAIYDYSYTTLKTTETNRSFVCDRNSEKPLKSMFKKFCTQVLRRKISVNFVMEKIA